MPGPKFDRAQLEHLAAGRISALFGPVFAAQDEYAVQIRMPEPPLLLADRVTGIDAVPAALPSSATRHRHDLDRDRRAPDAWYLDDAAACRRAS